jgi:hypothetical protein
MKNISERLYQLLLKCLAFKSLVGIVLPTILLCLKIIDQTAWWIAVAAVLFARAYEKTSIKGS